MPYPPKGELGQTTEILTIIHITYFRNDTIKHETIEYVY